MSAASIHTTYLRLRSDSSIEKLPVDASFWPRLMDGKLGDFHHEYLVTCSTGSSDWPTWEIHPYGDEIVMLLSGKATLLLEQDGEHVPVELDGPGSFALVPKGTWHTARMHMESVMLFITAGEGTRGRPA